MVATKDIVVFSANDDTDGGRYDDRCRRHVTIGASSVGVDARGRCVNGFVCRGDLLLRLPDISSMGLDEESSLTLACQVYRESAFIQLLIEAKRCLTNSPGKMSDEVETIYATFFQ